jgi:TPR repeat protein
MHDEGQGVPENYKIATKWYTLVAEQGNAYAQNNLGTMYYQGEGVPQDNWIGMEQKHENMFYIILVSRFFRNRTSSC